jgi:hypothetical protein
VDVLVEDLEDFRIEVGRLLAFHAGTSRAHDSKAIALARKTPRLATGGARTPATGVRATSASQ